MNSEELEKMLQAVAAGSTSVTEARARIARAPLSELGYARVDHHRQLRQGMPEVVFGEKKSVSQLLGIIESLRSAGQNVLVTRLSAEKAAKLQQLDGSTAPAAQQRSAAQSSAQPSSGQPSSSPLRYNVSARTLSQVVSPLSSPFSAPVAIVTAGTSDESVAEEAAETLRMAGAQVDRIYDVGVAGVHRLLEALPQIERAPAVICIAGMEGALPSVVGGLVAAPVVAVPTSVGYGVAFSGMTALCSMLTGCASGVTVVNVDNGFGAAMAVLRMGRAPAQAQREELAGE